MSTSACEAGPLSAHEAAFAAFLVEQGYRPSSLLLYERAFRKLGRFLGRHRLGLGDLTPEVAAAILADRDGHWPPRARPAVVLSYLRAFGLVPVSPAPPPTPLEALLEDYRRFLLGERRLGLLTVTGYLATARWFTIQCGEGETACFESLGARDVSAFVLEAARTHSAKTVNNHVVGLRSFLRFLHLQGLIAAPLSQATPWMASGALSSLPRALEPGTAERLLESCDRSHLGGKRDYAVLKVLSRLGLRAGEVAALELSDLDWERGELAVAGKGGRRDLLPLPIDVGEALSSYLTARGRGGPLRTVFSKLHAPKGPMSMSNVRAVVRAACERCGIPDTGAHRFRHGLASELLSDGAPLEEIGQLLRHGNPKTTALYARVDLASLSSLATPWPGSRR